MNINANIDDFIEDDDEILEEVCRWVTFRLANEVYGVEVERVREILKVNNILPVPGSPDFILGITNIRGNVVSVMDGRQRLNLGCTASELTDKSRMIILETEDDDVVAVVVDNVSDIIDVPLSSLESNPRVKTNENSQYITGIISHESNLVIALSTDKLISDEHI